MTRIRLQLLTGALFLSAALAPAQAKPAASGPGSYAAVGGAISGFRNPYGERYIAGATMYVDVNPTWRYGFEAEGRTLRLNQDEGVTLKNYFVGVRVAALPGRIVPYGKFMIGAGTINFPFQYAKGTFFAMAPGGGVDYRLNNYITLRAVDVEYQMWQDFSFGTFRPYGVSTGITVRLTPLSRIPKHAYYARR